MINQTTRQASDEAIDILLVEDSPGDVRLTKEAFAATDRATTLHVVSDGEEAIDFLKRRTATESVAFPDLALVDLKLPGMDGREVLETIRDDPRLEPLPVLVLTGSSDREDVERCYASQANAYLTKPTGPDEFASLARTVEQFWFEQVQLPPTTRF